MNQFCGPAVLSALTGESTDRCAAVISSINGKREIKAVNTQDLMKAFKKLRFDVTEVPKTGYTLYGTLTGLSLSGNAFYVIMVPNHVVAVEVLDKNIYLIDNHSKTPLPAESSARLSQRVLQVWKVVRKGESKFVGSEIKVEKFNYSIEVHKYNHYEDKNDDTKQYIGCINFKGEEEFQQIIEALKRL